jgi:hypothetical protein
MTRRDALKLGTGTAISAATTPLLSSQLGKTVTATEANLALGSAQAVPNSGDEICCMLAVDMLAAIRAKKLSAREVMHDKIR